jgi:hypothetical protein
MSHSSTDLEDALRRLLQIALADGALAREFGSSQEEFFAAGTGAPDEAGERRHLEWFLFERPAESLGGVPAEVLTERHAELAPYAEAFLRSLVSVFEVAANDPEEGLWLRDLFALGEHPVDAGELPEALRVGELLVGRLYPVGEGLYRLSPAAFRVRAGALAQALRADVEALRGTRRGVLRIAQAELERMFFSDGAIGGAGTQPAPARSAVDVARTRAAAHRALIQAAAPPELVEEILFELGQSAGDGRAAGEALNVLAFESEVDLDLARDALLDYCSALRGAVFPGATPPREAAAGRAQVESALERFDAGRQSGANLEELFRALELDLGLDPSGEGEESEEAPDFPGVVAAVVEEFLWETERERGQAQAERYAGLRRLGEFATSVGVIENLSERHLLEFSACWVLDRGLLGNAAAAKDLLAALHAFCEWCQRAQDLPLQEGFGPTLAGLERSLPRVVELRRRRAAPSVADARVYTFARTRDGQALLVDRAGASHAVALDEVLDGLLREGDLVQAALKADAEIEVGRVYPPELAALVS